MYSVDRRSSETCFGRHFVVPAKEAVIQLAFIALRCISRLPGAGRDPYRSRRGDSRGARSQKTFKLTDLWKHGSRLSPGTAREAHIKIVTMLVDTNWITALKAGTHSRDGHRPSQV